MNLMKILLNLYTHLKMFVVASIITKTVFAAFFNQLYPQTSILKSCQTLQQSVQIKIQQVVRNQKIYNKKMKLSTCLGEVLRFCDLFSISQFVRYKKDGQFKTASGGVISLIVISIFFALFLNVAIATINKSIINWSLQTVYSNQPTPTILDMSKNNFIFMVGVIGLNLNNPNFRYFDVKMYAKVNGQVGTPISSVNVPLQPCRQDHFYMNQQTKKVYHDVPASQWLCPPLNFSHSLYGKFTSKQMSFIQVDVTKCTPSLTDPRPCVNDATIDYMIQNYGPFNLAFFYINPLINAGKPEYLSYYLEARNWVTFTKNLGALTLAYVQDYQIDTDQSLLPLTQNNVEVGVAIPELFQVVVNQVANDKYATLMIAKSSISKAYTRSFNKVDQFFSYVGGLVGTILGLMLFMANFSQMAFALDLSQRIFKYKEDEDANFKSFSLLSYIAYAPYKIGRFFKKCQGWKEMRKREDCLKQAQKQLDISLIISKLNFLQKAVESLLGQQHYKELHKQKQEILAKIKARRRLYSKKSNGQQGQKQGETSQSDQNQEEGADSLNRVDLLQNSKATNLSFEKAKVHSENQLPNNLQPNGTYFAENDTQNQAAFHNVQRKRLKKLAEMSPPMQKEQMIESFNEESFNSQLKKQQNQETYRNGKKGAEVFKYEKY